MEEKHTEASINKKLDSYYCNNSKFRIMNAFIFAWESDFFILRDNGYCVEFEIKISRSDFLNDKNKVNKHNTLKDITIDYKPNKFFYVVPEGLISVDEVPYYAGLMYITKYGVITKKEAKFLHKEKHTIKIQSELCSKYYYRLRDEKFNNSILRQENKRLLELLKTNNINYIY